MERDVFAENGITYLSPFVSLGERDKVAEQLYEALHEAFDLNLEETQKAVFRKFSVLRNREQQLGVELVHELGIQATGAIFGRKNPAGAEP